MNNKQNTLNSQTITIGTTPISLGGTTTTLSGLSSISATAINGYKSNNVIIENSSGSLLASNVISGNLTGFGYASYGWPTNGSFISFGGFGSETYVTQIQGQYGGNGNNLYFRTVNNDSGVANPWYTIYNSGNFNNSSTSITASTGTFSGLLTANAGIMIGNGTKQVTLTVDSSNNLMINNSVYSLGSLSGYGLGNSVGSTAPTSSSATGAVGEVIIVSGYVYVCVATNTWQRAALTTF